MVVDALKQREGHSMMAACAIDDCLSIMVEFEKVTIEHYNRQSYVVAHELAR